MKLQQIEALIEEKVKLIEINAKSLEQAKERAGEFLSTSAIILTYLKDLEIQMIKVRSMLEASHVQAIMQVPGNKITEKKAQAQIDPSYVKYREIYETLESQRDWLKGFLKIFDNAHLMFRQYSKEQ